MARKNYDKNDCYNHFISKAEEDKIAYEQEYKDNEEKVIYLYNELNNSKDVIYNKFNINLDSYIEFTNKEIDEEHKLYDKTMKFIKILDDEESLKLLNTIIKYCNTVKVINDCKKSIELCNKRKNITFNVYKNLIKKYYLKVNEKALEGNGVRFSNGLGIFTINYNKTSESDNDKHIDFQATNKAKEELIKRGLKPYNKKEAEEYERAGITYDGIECTVYKEGGYKLYVDMIAPTAFRGGMLKIIPVNSIPVDLRGNTYQDFADKFTEKELNRRNIYILARAEANLKRNPLNYLRYIHKINL